MKKQAADKIILLSPAGDFSSLAAALANGADAVYFGVGKFNMRSLGSTNFRQSDLVEVVRRCHQRGVYAWLALNCVIYESELSAVARLCAAAKAACVDAIIAADVATMQIARDYGLEVHLSVQANICNSHALLFYSRFVDVVVLARELTLSQIQQLCDKIKRDNITGPSGNLLQVEVFIHGALCMAVAGSCHLSLAEYNSSANRGACLQNCRRAYTLRDNESGAEVLLDHHYLLSPKDLCTLPIMDKIIAAGVSVLKIEGRGRPADYVGTVTAVYREAIDRLRSGKESNAEKMAAWQHRLQSVFNRGFWNGGYYLGEKTAAWAKSGDNQATRRKTCLGPVVNFFNKAKIVEVKLNSGKLEIGDQVLIIGPTTGAIEFIVREIRKDGVKMEKAEKGDRVTFPCPEKVRPNDLLYRYRYIH